MKISDTLKNFRNSIYFSLLKGNFSIKFGYFLDKAGALLYNVRLLFETKGRALRQVLFKEKQMQKIRLKLKAYDHRVLDRTVAAIVEAVKRTGADVRGPVPMPTKIKRYTVLRSPHVNKDSREQFEMKIHARMLDIVAATPDTVDSLTKLDLAPEVNVEVHAMGK